jgi:hypothetical protein
VPQVNACIATYRMTTFPPCSPMQAPSIVVVISPSCHPSGVGHRGSTSRGAELACQAPPDVTMVACPRQRHRADISIAEDRHDRRAWTRAPVWLGPIAVCAAACRSGRCRYGLSHGVVRRFGRRQEKAKGRIQGIRQGSATTSRRETGSALRPRACSQRAAFCTRKHHSVRTLHIGVALATAQFTKSA